MKSRGLRRRHGGAIAAAVLAAAAVADGPSPAAAAAAERDAACRAFSAPPDLAAYTQLQLYANCSACTGAGACVYDLATLRCVPSALAWAVDALAASPADCPGEWPRV